ncbi:MAG: TIGR00730 family Rossman fold protein [Rhodospirillaceae bacterium]
MTELKSLCVFCGSSPGNDVRYADSARALGRALGEAGVELVFGAGGVGIMGAVAQACLDAGGAVTGIIPEHLTQAEAALPGLTETIVVPDMHTRKRIMFDRSDAFCVLPGGFGTMDETFEILTWKQLGLHDKPVVIVDVAGYWKPFLTFTESMLTEGFIKPRHLDLFSVVARIEDVLPAARREVLTADEEAHESLF